MNKFLLITILLVTSCSSFSGTWGSWKSNSVPLSNKVWRFCRQELDGPKYHEKGICYQDQECRHRRTIFGKHKSQCRTKILFCEWGDIDCLKRYNLFFNIIINEGVSDENI